MKTLLLAMVLFFAMAIPAFAQNEPVKVKPLLLYTQSEGGDTTPWYNPGNTIYVGMVREAKGCGSYKNRIEILNSKGILIQRIKFGNWSVCNSTFEGMTEIEGLGPAPETGYYTIRAVYVDLVSGNTWSHQTKIHVIPID